jgi:hypothetical protein
LTRPKTSITEDRDIKATKSASASDKIDLYHRPMSEIEFDETRHY